jgi:ABC-type Fe3+-hydroxamate transport system substrate-binding protein
MRGMFMTFCALIAVLGVASGPAGCRDRADGAATLSPPTGELRIVSLSPALSRTLVDFGLERSIVGRTPWCDAVDASVPVVGDLYNLDYEAVVRLGPTHVLIQPPSTGVDQALIELGEQRGWTIGQWKLDSISDIEAMVTGLPALLAGEDPSLLDRLTRRSADIQNAMALSISPRGLQVFRGRTLVVVGYDPPMAFGPGTYMHDLLAAMGGRNAIHSGAYVSLTLEDVVRLDPEAIIVIDPHAREQDDARAILGPLADAPIAAVRTDRVARLTNPGAIAPSTAIVEVADELRAILVSFAAGGS